MLYVLTKNGSVILTNRFFQLNITIGREFTDN